MSWLTATPVFRSIRSLKISRFIESNLDREVEDFELSVFSAGLSEPLSWVVRQYKKNIGTEIDVLLTSGQN